MPDTYIEDQTYEKRNFAETPLIKADYENCVFKNCNFSGVNLSSFKFIDCSFHDCDLSLAKLNETGFQQVRLINCKMLGLRFDTCNEFGLSVSFDRCLLNHASFYGTKILKTIFKDTQLQETDFSESNFTGTTFDNCDLAQAIFHNTILEKTDFRTSFNYTIDPEENQIKKAKFSLLQVSGLLSKYDIELF